MEPLVVVLAAIFALNLAYGLFIGLCEVRRHRRARREIGTLEAMWRFDPRAPHRTERWAPRSLRFAGVLAASLMVLGGIAVATPGGRETVSTVTQAIGSLISVPDGQVAEAPERPTTPTAGPADPRANRTPGGDQGGAVNHDVAPGRESPSETVDDDPVLSQVTEPVTVTEVPDPNSEQSSDDGDPTTEPSQSPVVDPPPAITLQVESVSATSVTLTWNEPPSATEYQLERSSGSSEGWTVVAAGLTGASRTDGGVTPETEYTYRVTATLEDGSSLVDEVTALTPAAPVP